MCVLLLTIIKGQKARVKSQGAIFSVWHQAEVCHEKAEFYSSVSMYSSLEGDKGTAYDLSVSATPPPLQLTDTASSVKT